MIEEIGIRDLGVIAEATLPLGAGFTAVTVGEASASVVKSGTPSALNAARVMFIISAWRA